MKKLLCLLVCVALLFCGCSAPDEELLPKALEEFDLSTSGKLDMDISGRFRIESDGFPQIIYFGAKAELTASEELCSGVITMDASGIRLEFPLYIELNETGSTVYSCIDGNTWIKESEPLGEESASPFDPASAVLAGSETVGEITSYRYDTRIPGEALDLEDIWELVGTTQSSELFEMDAAELPAITDLKASLWVDGESGSISRISIDAAEGMSELMTVLLTKSLELEAKDSGIDVPDAAIFAEELYMDIYISELGTAQPEPVPAEVRENAIDMAAISEERGDALSAACVCLMSLDLSSDGLEELLKLDEYSEEDIAFALENCGADWEQEAADYARHTLASGGFSEKTLKEQMELEKFDAELADKAIASCSPDWDKEAKDFAAYNINFSSVSRALLEETMLDSGFTQEQSGKALESCGADWDAEARELVDELLEAGGYSEALVKTVLEEMLFEEAQIEHAIPADVDWNEQAKLYATRCAEQKIGYSQSTMKYMLTEYASFTAEQADYAIENSEIDWNLQAEYAARTYLLEAPYSYQRMINLLQEEDFSYDQAVFGADSCGADWYAETIRTIHVLEDEFGDRLMQYGPSSAWVTLSLELQYALFPLDLIRPALAECGYYN